MRKYRFWAMVCLLGLCLSLAGTAAAALQTITAAGVYTMGDGETLAAAKERFSVGRFHTVVGGMHLHRGSRSAAAGHPGGFHGQPDPDREHEPAGDGPE